MKMSPYVKEALAKQKELSPEEYDLWLKEIRGKFNDRAYFTRIEKYKILQRYSWRCASCEVRLQISKKKGFGYEVAHLDHIHPISKWFTYEGPGLNSSENIQPLCGPCNRKKSDKVLE